MLKFIILGIVQGLTEFLPVSSSAHLVFLQKALGVSGQEVVLTVVLHLGTVLASIVFFFKDIIATLRNFKLLGLTVIVTFITGVIGILGKDFFERLFSDIVFAAAALVITGLMLIFTRNFLYAKRDMLNLKDAVILGFMQAVAIIPGISRSGITISTLLFRRINREVSFRFSFIASIPVVLGASMLEAKGIGSLLKKEFVELTWGFLFSFITGIFALWVLKIILNKAKLHYFGYYCILIAVIALVFLR